MSVKQRKGSNKNKLKMKSSDDGLEAACDLRNDESGDDNNEHLNMHLKKGDINSNEYDGEDEINIRGEESDNNDEVGYYKLVKTIGEGK